MIDAQQAAVANSSALNARSQGHSIILLILCGMVALLDGADAQSLAIAAPLIAQALAIPSAVVGLMFSSAALGGAVGYVVGGWVAGRWGAKRTVAASAVVIGIFQLATCYAADAGSLIVVRCVVALGLSGAVPGLITLVAQLAPPRWQYRIQGFVWACFPLGALTGGLGGGWILHHGQWQTIFIVGGIAPLIVATVLWSIADVAASGKTRADAAAGIGIGSGGSHTERVFVSRVWARALLIGLIFLFANGAIAVVMNWTPSLLVRAGYTPATGATVFAWNAAGALLSMTFSGFVVERSMIAPIAIGLAAASAATVLGAFFIHSITVVTILMVIIGSMLGLAGTAAVFLAGSLFPGAGQARGLGICMAVGRAGQIAFPGFIGLYLQAGASSSATLLLTAAFPASGALAALLFGWHSKRLVAGTERRS